MECETAARESYDVEDGLLELFRVKNGHDEGFGLEFFSHIGLLKTLTKASEWSQNGFKGLVRSV